MKKILSVIFIIVLLCSPVFSEESDSYVCDIIGNRENIYVYFNGNIYNAEAEIYSVSSSDIVRIISVSSYNSEKNMLTLKLSEKADLYKQYEIVVKYGESLENTYSTYLKYDILKESDKISLKSIDPTLAFPLNDEKEIYNTYRDYSVEFMYKKKYNTQDNNIIFTFFSDSLYQKYWNYHGSFGINISFNSDEWTLWNSYGRTSGKKFIKDYVHTNGKVEDVFNKDTVVCASVLKDNISLSARDDYGKNLYSLYASAPITQEDIKNNFGVFTLAAYNECEIENVILYKLTSLENYSDDTVIHNIDFIKNADTIAKADLIEEVIVKDADGNSVLNEKGEEKKINSQYAEIDSDTWFNGLSANKFGMYFSGLKSTFFPIDGVMKFKKVYREDTLSEDGEVIGSKYKSSNEVTYDVCLDINGFNAKEKDAFVLCNDSEKTYHAPVLSAELKKLPTKSVRFVMQTNVNVLNVKIDYTDGTSDSYDILTGQHGNIVYSSYWKDFYKYFKQYDEEVTAGIIAQYVLGSSEALYPYGYKNSYDYASVEKENTVSGDIRYVERKIRYYTPRLFLFEVKTDVSKYAENIEISVNNSNPSVVYSIMQCEQVRSSSIHHLNFEKNADTIAYANLKKEVTLKDENGNTILDENGEEKTIEVNYDNVERELWFNGIPQNKFGMYFSGLKGTAFPDNGELKFRKVYREDELSEDGTLINSIYRTSADETYSVRLSADGFNANKKDAFLLINEEGKDYHSPSLEVKLNALPSEAVRFVAQTNVGNINVKVSYKDGTYDSYDILSGQHGNIVYSSRWADYHKYFKTFNEETNAGIIGEYTFKNGSALYPYDYISAHDYAALSEENTVSGDIRYSSQSIRYYEPRLFLYEVKTDSLKIPDTLEISVNTANPFLIYSVIQCENSSRKIICRSFFANENETVLKLEAENIPLSEYKAYFAVYSKDKKLLGVSGEIEDNIITLNNINNDEICFAKLFLWDNSDNMNPLWFNVDIYN